MGYEISLSPRAMREIEEALDYYSISSENISRKFYNELENSFEILTTNPFLEVRYRSMRALPMQVFPYLILFTIEEHTVNIYSVFNTYQSLKKYPS